MVADPPGEPEPVDQRPERAEPGLAHHMEGHGLIAGDRHGLQGLGQALAVQLVGDQHQSQFALGDAQLLADLVAVSVPTLEIEPLRVERGWGPRCTSPGRRRSSGRRSSTSRFEVHRTCTGVGLPEVLRLHGQQHPVTGHEETDPGRYSDRPDLDGARRLEPGPVDARHPDDIAGRDHTAAAHGHPGVETGQHLGSGRPPTPHARGAGVDAGRATGTNRTRPGVPSGAKVPTHAVSWRGPR